MLEHDKNEEIKDSKIQKNNHPIPPADKPNRVDIHKDPIVKYMKPS